MERMSREEIRFLADVAAHPLSTTVSRYQRLNLSRRPGNAVRQHLASAGIIEAVSIATRSGQVVLNQITDAGRSVCNDLAIDPGPGSQKSIEHRYWTIKTAQFFEDKGYEITHEHVIKGNGAIDILAERPGEKIAVEVETGKSNISVNISKARDAGLDRIVLIATSPAAVTACQKIIDSFNDKASPTVELMTWLDI